MYSPQIYPVIIYIDVNLKKCAIITEFIKQNARKLKMMFRIQFCEVNKKNQNILLQKGINYIPCMLYKNTCIKGTDNILKFFTLYSQKQMESPPEEYNIDDIARQEYESANASKFIRGVDGSKKKIPAFGDSKDDEETDDIIFRKKVQEFKQGKHDYNRPKEEKFAPLRSKPSSVKVGVDSDDAFFEQMKGIQQPAIQTEDDDEEFRRLANMSLRSGTF